MMEGDSGGLQRKVAGRKRGPERQSKTPKKPKYDNADQERHHSTKDSAGEPAQKGGWIQNSFASTQRVASRQVTTAKRSKVEDVHATTTLDNAAKSETSVVTQMQSGTTGAITPPRNRRSKVNDMIFCNLTSTPIDEGWNKELPAVHSEKYASQHHESFDESDSVFADLDMATFDNASSTNTTSTRKSARKVSVAKLAISTSARKSSAKKRQARQKETFKRFSQSHPIADLQKGQQAGTGVEDLNFDSDDSLFGDSGITDSILGSLPVNNSPEKKSSCRDDGKTGCKTETKQSNLISQKLPSDSQDVNNSNLNKTLVDNSTTTSQANDDKSKRKSIEFRSVSGSQLSFEEEEAKATVELLSPKGNSNVKQPDSSNNGSKMQGLPEPEKLKVGVLAPNTPGSGCGPVSGVTPGSARARLLRNKLRRTETPGSNSGPVARASRMKAAHLEQALKEAEKERATGTEFDIGPFYGLPSKVPELFQQHRGIKSLYAWQHECLTLDAVRAGRNLIYSLPTSGGKTLVAEVLMLKELLCKKKDVLFILPFVAIVQEKVKALTSFALDLDFVVEEYAASKGSMPPRVRRKRKAIYIATIEKGAGLINSLIEAERVHEIGLVVIDELHMLGEGGSRGAILEMTITKLIHASVDTQLIGMSATLNNISDLSQFMKADVYSNDFRPVELREYVKIEDTVYEIDQKALCPDDRLRHSRVCMYKYDAAMQKADPDHLSGLVQEVIPNHSCLVFCPTKKNCENVAMLLCNLLPRELTMVKHKERQALMKILWQEGNGEVCPVLRRTVPFGLAYHHSGLTVDERRLIEEAYLDGTLCLLTCTSTLAAGVNLPAKRVILRAPKVAATFLSRSQYKQMVGRAGRAGLDSSGESIMILEKKDRAQMLNLVSGPCDVCRSSLLYESHKGLRRLLLTTIGLKITPTLESVSALLQLTLCYVQRDQQETDILGAAQGSLQSLVDKGLIQQTVEEVTEVTGTGPVENTVYRLEVTRLGRAVYKGSIDIDRGQQLYGDLRQAQSSLVVANYLHLLYLVTPYDMVGSINPDWMTYLDQLSRFEEDEMKVVNLIGLSESYIAKKASGQRVRKNVDEAVVGRFYLTLILYNLFRQRSIWEVSEVFCVPRGMVQNILNLASTFAACITHFCQELEEFWAYQDLFGNFVKKLSFCFMTDLIPLMEIPGVKTGRARQLYNAGYKTLQQVAYAEADVLVRSIEHLPRKVATAIITAAKVLLNERVEALQEEAEQMISAPSEMPSGEKSENQSTLQQADLAKSR